MTDSRTMNDGSKSTLNLTNILLLTDFSACSDAAFRWAIDIARANGSTLSVLHVVVPDTLTYLTPVSPAAAADIQESWARGEMQKIDKQLAGLPHHTIVKRGTDVWAAVEPELEELRCDLIVLGTHGRTGIKKLLLGSMAEQVVRRSTVPVLTVGSRIAQSLEVDGKFHRVLVATDFAPGSAAIAEYGTALAERNQAELVLLHACKPCKRAKSDKFADLSVAEALHRLHELVRHSDTLQCDPETLVRFGDASTQILEVAGRKKADLIVMGVRKAGSVLAATHLETGTMHNVVARATCPVLTVRPMVAQPA